MSSILIAESGSTKTDWCLAGATKRPLYYKTSGINPYLQSEGEIIAVLENELKLHKHKPEQLYYYGAGAGSKQKQTELKKVLANYFGIKSVEVNSDMLAAARAMCGHDKGVVAILGTGSNSCYYDGKKAKTQSPSL
ncbi:MAG: hypothetical protein KDC11_03255 [Chitinophagaceae bacterium]|nr:hypothetical protein [Chitinophagaceae bacterium]